MLDFGTSKGNALDNPREFLVDILDPDLKYNIFKTNFT